MTNTFKQRVLNELIVDTRNYRYRAEHTSYHDKISDSYVLVTRIKRIPIDLLDTTAAINGWEVVSHDVEAY